MYLKKIAKEDYKKVAQDVVNCNFDFKKVSRKYAISEMVVINLFKKYGNEFVKKTDVEQQLEELTVDYFDKQRMFIQKAHDVKLAAVKRIEILLETEDDLDDISKAIDILDKITDRSKDDMDIDGGKDDQLSKL